MKCGLFPLVIGCLLLVGCQVDAAKSTNSITPMHIKPVEMTPNELMLTEAMSDVTFWLEIGDIDKKVRSVSIGMDYFIGGVLTEESTEMGLPVNGQYSHDPLKNVLISIDFNESDETIKHANGTIMINHSSGNSSYKFTRDFDISETTSSLWTGLPEEELQMEIGQKQYVGYYVAGEDSLSTPSLLEPFQPQEGHQLAFYIQYHTEKLD